MAANQIVPLDRRFMIEPESPVWSDALGNRRAFGLALVDRRKAPAEQHLAAKVQLFGGLVTGVDAARLAQPFEFALVKAEALRLSRFGIGTKA